jgi:hypothetical protein
MLSGFLQRIQTAYPDNGAILRSRPSIPAQRALAALCICQWALPGATSSNTKADAVGETNIPKVRQLNRRQPAMGDRSPKSVQKQASQKQSKNNDSNQKKQALITSQQATKAKLAANKKR